jgi:tetratricopeptide (TPR) repeat protein
VAIDRAVVLRNAEKLLRQGKLDGAIAEYRRVVEDQPRDWNTANTLGDLYLRAGQTDRAVEQYVGIADSLSRDGFLSKAAALYKKILKIRPDDEHALLQAGEMAASQGVLVDARTYLNAVAARRLARGDEGGAAEIRARLFTVYLRADDLERAREFAATNDQLTALGHAFAARGDAGAAAEFLTAETAGTDPELLLKVAQAQLAAGAVDDGLSILRQLLNQDASRANPVAAVAWEIAASAPDAALRVVEMVAETAIIEADWVAAAAVLQQFVDLVPNHVPALQRLVEICFDGELETALCAAQSRLADAYLLSGCAAEARVIAEDLITRGAAPEHVEQLRRALVMLGEPDPESVIAERFGQTLDDASSPIRTEGEVGGGVTRQPDVEQPRERVDDIAPSAATEAGDDAFEIDLSDMLADFTVVAAPGPSPPPGDLDEVFERLREGGSHRPAADAARMEYDRAMALRESGRIEESISAFEAASRDPELRFRAAAALAHVYQQRQERGHAVEWLEQAVQAPPPHVDEAHALFYELADTLESIGERERALAVCLELQAEAGDYRDLPERIRRLTQARG